MRVLQGGRGGEPTMSDWSRAIVRLTLPGARPSCIWDTVGGCERTSGSAGAAPFFGILWIFLKILIIFKTYLLMFFYVFWSRWRCSQRWRLPLPESNAAWNARSSARLQLRWVESGIHHRRMNPFFAPKLLWKIQPIAAHSDPPYSMKVHEFTIRSHQTWWEKR